MWEKWKKKIKELFTDNATEEVTQPKPLRESGKQDIQARVSYQYPKQKSFRFPVIPDENVNPERKSNRDVQRNTKKENIRPVQARKRNETNSTEVRNRTKRSTENHNIPQMKNKPETQNRQQTSFNNNKIYKKTDKPFQPTEVPSPIYGFQKRDKPEKDIKDIPAFLRKEEKHKKEVEVRDFELEIKNKNIHTNEIFGSTQEAASTLEEEKNIEEIVEKEAVLSESLINNSVTKEKMEAGHAKVEQSQHIKETTLIEEQQQHESEIDTETFELDEKSLSLNKDIEEIENIKQIHVESGDPSTAQEQEGETTEELKAEEAELEIVEDLEAEEAETEIVEDLEAEEAETEIVEDIEVEEAETETVEEQKFEQVETHTPEDPKTRDIDESTTNDVSEEHLEESVEEENKEHTTQEKKPYVFPFNVIMTPSDKRNLRRRQFEKNTNKPVINKKNAVTSNNAKVDKPEVVGNSATDSITTKAANDENQEESIETFIPYYLLNDPIQKSNDSRIWVEEQQRLLEQTLIHFNVGAKVVKATQGPSVTRFEVQPELGVKVSKIKNLSDDLKLNMAARDIRIEAPIPGKNTVGIEIPNQNAEMVGLQEIFDTEDFKESESPLTIALGLSIEGEPKITNIQKMPHGLIAGATGSGKSVCINTMLISLIYKASHEDVKILLIDPKMVELAPYNGIPHLVAPVITDVKAATQSLKWAVNEMEDRYSKFVHEGVRNIEGYNKKIKQQGRLDEKMSFIVIVIDELADLMMTSPQDVEDSISRIAQKARACGIHLILATQRPSVDVITGLIKANIPTRIAFSVSSQVDSRTIIDLSGAEKLLGKGDMLFVENGAGKSVRLQGPFVSDEEIERVTNYARSIAEPNYLFEQEELLEQVHIDEEEDDLLQDVIDFVLNQNSASTSMIQRRFKIGYNRAARLIDTLEYRGIISGQNGSKPRDVLISQKQEEL